MGVETRKQTSNSSTSNSEQNRVFHSKERENSKHGKKRTHSEDDKQTKIIFRKSVLSDSVNFSINREMGLSQQSSLHKFGKEAIIRQLKRFSVHKTYSPFDRRVTSIAWHPNYPTIVAVGSKAGDLVIQNMNDSDYYYRPGIGPGGSVLGLKCSYKDPFTLYSAALTGEITRTHFNKNESNVVYALPMSLENWFTSIDVCNYRQSILFGDCLGSVYLMNSSENIVWIKKKLHRSKVTHCEFNAHDPNIFVTASLDHSVKLWDLRYMEAEKPEPLMSFSHVKGVNSAYFSRSNGLNLLTTDQHSEIRVYCSPCWTETLSITHPHRQFQHMTPIKATWHPIEDIIIVGRYPDDHIQVGDMRTIDFYDGSNGQLLYSITSPSGNIASLNAMNITGEYLASAAGCPITYLKESHIEEALSSHDSDDDSENTPQCTRQKKRPATSVSKKSSSKTNKLSKKI